jgi:hypothetical protein
MWRDDSDAATSVNCGVASSSSSSSNCMWNPKMGIMRIRAPLKNTAFFEDYCIISEVNTLNRWARTSGPPPIYLPRGQAPRFSYSWSKYPVHPDTPNHSSLRQLTPQSSHGIWAKALVYDTPQWPPNALCLGYVFECVNISQQKSHICCHSV